MPSIPLDPTALTVIFFALGIGAFIKGMTGGGLPLVAVPIMAIFLDVEHAVIVLQVPNVVSNVWLVWSHRRQFKEAPIKLDIMAPSAITLVIGVWFLSSADKQMTLLLLAVILGAFLLLLLAKPDFKLEGKTNKIVTPVASSIGGFAQGATGVSGPVYSPLLYALRLGKEPFVFYNGFLYGFFNVVQIGAMIWFGMFTTERVLQGVIALIPLFIFQYVGMKMTSRVSLTTFNKVVVAILVVMEAKLVWDVIVG